MPPPPNPDARWKETSDTDSCSRIGVDGKYRAAVEAAVQLAMDSGLAFPWPKGEAALYAKVAPFLSLPSALYWEEFAVQNGEGFSENYDLLTTSGELRSGSGTYRSTCGPATRSAPIEAPPPLPSSKYPAPVRVIDIRVYTHPSPTKVVVDATAKACGSNPDFPGRQCWPACGPEGAHPEGCDASLNPVWEGPGAVRGNPWQYHCSPGARVRVCSQGVCSAWITAE